jgi:hypothetical protein
MSGGNVQKTPLVSTLNRFAESKATDNTQQLGKSLPCSVVTVVSSGVVVVKFEVQSSVLGATLPNVMVPVAWPEYIRYPVQKGDKGMCVTADAYLGGVSGLGGGVAGLVQQGNLAALAFQPLGNKAWTATTDPNAVVIYGVQGRGVTLLSDIGGQTVKLVLTNQGVTITGNLTLNGNMAVNGAVTATGNVTAGQGSPSSVEVLGHVHINGSSTTGPPKPGS